MLINGCVYKPLKESGFVFFSVFAKNSVNSVSAAE